MGYGIEVDGHKFCAKSLGERPRHAEVLGRIFTNWSLIEAHIGGLLGVLMHAEPKAGIAILSTFGSNYERVKATRKIAGAILKKEESADFDLLMKRVLKYAEKRNKFAHGIWGYRVDDEEHVFRLPSTALEYFPLLMNVWNGHTGGSPNNIDSKQIVDQLLDGMEKFDVGSLESVEEVGTIILDDVAKSFLCHIKRRTDIETQRNPTVWESVRTFVYE